MKIQLIPYLPQKCVAWAYLIARRDFILLQTLVVMFGRSRASYEHRSLISLTTLANSSPQRSRFCHGPHIVFVTFFSRG
ncbi:hypothetical protein DFH29DRAFT_484788 [Suillus ampliporus]|nr:hypothetical protein DFH29DRAFT_484788 [Suillus ampliporus]